MGENETKHLYHFDKDKWMKYILENGLEPHNGKNSQAVGDQKKAVFYSQGMEGAVALYMDFLKHFEDFKGQKGDKILSAYEEALQNREDVDDNHFKRLEKQANQIKKIRQTKTMDEYIGEGPYLEIFNLEQEDIQDEKFNFIDSWTTKAIPKENLKVVALKEKTGDRVLTSKKDIIHYFLGQIGEKQIMNISVYKELREFMVQYYKEHSEELEQLSEEYELTHISLEKYVEEYMPKQEKCYHMTSHLMEILSDKEPGLKPFVGENSKHVNDTKEGNRGVSYSLGLEGIITTNAMFRARYQYDKLEDKADGDVTLDDMFIQDVKEQEAAALAKNVYLTFDETEKMREENQSRDISDPKTKSPIDIKDIKGVILKNSKTGEIKYDRESIIRYAISKINLDDILSKMKKSDRPFMNMEGYAKTDFSFKQYVERYYEEIQKDSQMLEFKNGEYELQEIDVHELLNIIQRDNIVEMAQTESKDLEHSEGKSGFDDSMKAEIKASDVQKATQDVRREVEQQKQQTNEKKQEDIQIGEEG